MLRKEFFSTNFQKSGQEDLFRGPASVASTNGRSRGETPVAATHENRAWEKN
jgi:hypothetical protein